MYSSKPKKKLLVFLTITFNFISNYMCTTSGMLWTRTMSTMPIIKYDDDVTAMLKYVNKTIAIEQVKPRPRHHCMSFVHFILYSRGELTIFPNSENEFQIIKNSF